jgi:hypothetical protein
MAVGLGDDAGCSLTVGAATGGGDGGGGGGAIMGSIGGGETLAGPSWNQLWRQLAQRTWRPDAPIALSGTTYRVRQEGQTSNILLPHKHQHTGRCNPARCPCAKIAVEGFAATIKQGLCAKAPSL